VLDTKNYINPQSKNYFIKKRYGKDKKEKRIILVLFKKKA